ncbi:Complement C1Q Tumor Necrosis Factor-Related Protein 6 [Manis pentadactyla]|nr:Complement C1Q Tumor Necrosis Factor-Related Protein 6 [Manis pentadactyla]
MIKNEHYRMSPPHPFNDYIIQTRTPNLNPSPDPWTRYSTFNIDADKHVITLSLYITFAITSELAPNSLRNRIIRIAFPLQETLTITEPINWTATISIDVCHSSHNPEAHSGHCPHNKSDQNSKYPQSSQYSLLYNQKLKLDLALGSHFTFIFDFTQTT